MNEIKVTAPDVAYKPSQVVCDFSNLDKDIEEVEKRYLNWVPSEVETKEADRIAKEINGVAKDLNDRKVKIKKEINKESKYFEDEVMLRVNRLKAVRQNIVDGLDVFEQKRINERKDRISAFLEENKGELDIPFDIVFESRFTNKSCTEKDWKESVLRKINDLKLDYDLLEKMNYEDIPLLQSIFTQKWNRLAAIDEYENQMEARRRADEIKQTKEEKRTVIKPEEETAGTGFAVTAEPKPEKSEVLVTKKFEITGTSDDFEALNKFMVMNDLFCKEIKNG